MKDAAPGQHLLFIPAKAFCLNQEVSSTIFMYVFGCFSVHSAAWLNEMLTYPDMGITQ